MNKDKNLLSSLKWIFAVSKRFALVDRTGRTAVTSKLSTLGICFGVMTLITVMSVMNGFQMSFVKSIIEISSSHLPVKSVPEEKKFDFLQECEQNSDILTVSPFYESRGLIASKRNFQAAVIVRGVNKDILDTDKGFAKELKTIKGSFDIEKNDSIVLGIGLADSLNVTVGSSVNLLAMSGSKDVSLISYDRNFIVTGIFESGSIDVNQAYAFINISAAQEKFGSNLDLTYGLKLKNYNDDFSVISSLKKVFPEIQIESWRSFNRSLFGALRIEKNILFFLVFLIFIVVGTNIYNGVRRLVFECKQEISILSALGGSKNEIKSIFIARGFISGFTGTLFGLVLGLLICVNMSSIFMFISNFMFYSEYLFTRIFSPQNASFVRQNPMYQVFASIPAQINFSEVVLICVFGILAPLIASWCASHNVLKMNVTEVLHDE